MSEVLVALAATQRLALEWKQSETLLQPVVDDDFMQLVDSGAGFLHLAEMLATYEALETGRFESAKSLAIAILRQDPSRAKAALVLGLLLENVFEDRQAAGQVYLDLSRHTQVPQWLIELGHSLQDSVSPQKVGNSDASQSRSLSSQGIRDIENLICGLLARSRGETAYQQLEKKCAIIFQSKGVQP